MYIAVERFTRIILNYVVLECTIFEISKPKTKNGTELKKKKIIKICKKYFIECFYDNVIF